MRVGIYRVEGVGRREGREGGGMGRKEERVRGRFEGGEVGNQTAIPQRRRLLDIHFLFYPGEGKAR